MLALLKQPGKGNLVEEDLWKDIDYDRKITWENN